MKKKDNISIVLIGISWFLILSGIIVIGYYLIDLSIYFKIRGSIQPDIEKTGQVGDFIGGIVGSLWALAGVFLLFLTLRISNKQFKLQQNEMKLQRSEMQLNRITDLIKNQRNTLNAHIDQLELKIPNRSGGTKLNALYYVNRYVREYFASSKDMSKLSESEEVLFNHINNFLISQKMYDFIRDYQYSLGILSRIMQNYNEEFERLHNEIYKSDTKYLKSLITMSLNIQQLNYFMNSCKLFYQKKNEYLESTSDKEKLKDLTVMFENFEKANIWAKELCAHVITFE